MMQDDIFTKNNNKLNNIITFSLKSFLIFTQNVLSNTHYLLMINFISF